MTVATNYQPHRYLPGSAQAAEAIPFQYLDPADLVVERVSAGGVSILARDVHYTLSGDGTAGTGAITAIGAYGSDAFVLSRATDGRQRLELPAHQGLPARGLERQFDKGAMIAQEISARQRDLAGRAIQYPRGEQVPSLPPAAVRAGRFLSFDGLGQLLLSSASVVAQSIAPFLPTVLRGDPGGNVMSVGPFTSIANMTIPTGTDVLQTSGATRGRLVADTSLNDATAAAFPRTMVKTRNGRYFRRDEAVVDLREVGVNGSPGPTGDYGALMEGLAYLRRFGNDLSGVFRGTPRLKLAPYMRLDQPLSLKQTVIIEGDGNGLEGGQPTIIDCSHSFDGRGIVVERTNTSLGMANAPVTSGADGSILRNFLMIGGRTPTGQDAGAGISLKARAGVDNVFVQGFAGAGIRIVAAAEAVGERLGNANCSRVRDVTVYSCFDGVYIEGADANAILLEAVNANMNARGGVVDYSLLGNTHIGHHTSGNGCGSGGVYSIVSFDGFRFVALQGAEGQLATTQPGTNLNVWRYFEDGGPIPGYCPQWVAGGAYRPGGAYMTNNRNCRAVFNGCYTEGSQAPPQIMWPSMAIGGLFNNVGDGMWLNGEQGAVNAEAFQAGSTRLEQSGLFLDGPTVPSFRMKPHPGGYIRLDYNNSDAAEFCRWHGPLSARPYATEVRGPLALTGLLDAADDAAAAAKGVLVGNAYLNGGQVMVRRA